MQGTSPAEGGTRSDGRATRWDSHRASRHAELVRAARRAVHHRGAGISMEEIAAEIGTSKSILYRYFTDKAGLQAAVGQAVLGGLRDALEGAAGSAGRPRDRIEAMVAVYLEMVEQSPHVYAFVTRPEAEAAAGALRGFVADTEDMVAELLLPVLRELPGGGGDDVALARLWGAGFVGFVRAVAERWFGLRAEGADGGGVGPVDRGRLSDLITDWLWDGAVGVARGAVHVDTAAGIHPVSTPRHRTSP